MAKRRATRAAMKKESRWTVEAAAETAHLDFPSGMKALDTPLVDKAAIERDQASKAIQELQERAAILKSEKYHWTSERLSWEGKLATTMTRLAHPEEEEDTWEAEDWHWEAKTVRLTAELQKANKFHKRD